MRKLLFLLIVLFGLIPTASNAQNWGLGFRLGDPSGLTLKKYMRTHAVELSVGRTHLFSRDRYYYDRYDKWYLDQRFNYKEHQLLAHRVSSAIGVQLHYLVHHDDGLTAGLDWYYGFGAQLRMQRFRYDYRYKLEGNNDWFVVYDADVVETDLGLDGVLGVEYKFPDAPVAVFLDGTLFMELIDDPFIFRPQFGIGARYMFNRMK
jgi:hypothetical protein